MKKYYLIFASAAIAFASCTSDTYIGDQDPSVVTGEKAITFGFDVPTPTRAEGAAAATKLNNQFIVWAEKGEAASGAVHTADDGGANTHQLVFPNYKVTYGANTAYTSTSNTKDWEYVGLSYTAGTDADYVKMGGTKVTADVQTIKYWDYNAASYTFTAVSAKPTDINTGKVTINKLTSGSTVYDKGYEVDVTADADLNSIYFADRVYIEKTSTYDRTQPNQYGGNVKFTFRNGQSQVRVGMYEVIPGYEVKVTKFYYDEDANPGAGSTGFEAMTDYSTTNFVANVPNTATGVAGKFTVKYFDDTEASTENHPTISFAPTTASDTKTYITLGDQITAATKLGVTSTAATYDKADSDGDGVNDFTTFFPQETNDKNLKLKVDYQLKNTVTGETINITGKTAEVPAQYLQWKPNYKYTYIFKVNDNDLYPITFDAVTVEAEDGNVEYITTVSEPSITTYAKGSAVTTNGEYAAGEKVYAVVEDGSSLATLSASNMKLYTVTTSDATNFPITEASIAEAIAEYPIMSTAERTAAKIKFTASSFNYGKTIVAEDGSTVTMDASNNVVADFTTAANTVYAIEYIKTAATYGNDGGKVYTFADETEFDAVGTLYKEAACTNVAAYSDYTAAPGVKYYKKTHVTAVGTYAYKIVRVAGATGVVTP